MNEPKISKRYHFSLGYAAAFNERQNFRTHAQLEHDGHMRHFTSGYATCILMLSGAPALEQLGFPFEFISIPIGY
jgi:hypothetical protein